MSTPTPSDASQREAEEFLDHLDDLFGPPSDHDPALIDGALVAVVALNGYLAGALRRDRITTVPDAEHLARLGGDLATVVSELQFGLDAVAGRTAGFPLEPGRLTREQLRAVQSGLYRAGQTLFATWLAFGGTNHRVLDTALPEDTAPAEYRVRPGERGTFAGEWLAYTTDDGATRYRTGYVGTGIPSTGKWPEFLASRGVAEAIMAEQDRLRAALRASYADGAPHDAELDAAVDADYARLYFHGTRLICDQSGMPGLDEVVLTGGPNRAGEYEIGWSWPWRAVHPDLCDQVIGTL